MSRNTVLLGGGGLAIEIMGYANDYSRQNFIGYCDVEEKAEMRGILPYLGLEQEIHEDGLFYVIATGHMENRKKIIRDFIMPYNAQLDNVVASYCHISNKARIGDGLIVGPFASILGNAIVGHMTLVNVSVSIGHDCVIGNNVVLCPGARISGWSKVGDNSLVGSNTVVLPEGKIGEDALVSANSIAHIVRNGKRFYGPLI